MNRLASTRSDQRASQPLFPTSLPRAQCRVGSIDEDGIRYGLTTHALIASTIATAPAMVSTQSRTTRYGRGRRWVARAIGFLGGWSASWSTEGGATGAGPSVSAAEPSNARLFRGSESTS